MLKHLTWPLLLAGFFALAYYRGTPELHPQLAVTGTQLQNNTPKPNQTLIIRGVTHSRQVHPDGTRIIKLDSDDGTPITLVLPPEVDAKLPHPGQRIEAKGTQTSPTTLVINHHEDIATIDRTMDPQTSQVLTAWPDNTPAHERLTLEGDIEVLGTIDGGHYASLTHNHMFVAHLYVPDHVADQLHLQGHHQVMGTVNDKRAIIVEALDPQEDPN